MLRVFIVMCMCTMAKDPNDYIFRMRIGFYSLCNRNWKMIFPSRLVLFNLQMRKILIKLTVNLILVKRRTLKKRIIIMILPLLLRYLVLI